MGKNGSIFKRNIVIIYKASSVVSMVDIARRNRLHLFPASQPV